MNEQANEEGARDELVRVISGNLPGYPAPVEHVADAILNSDWMALIRASRQVEHIEAVLLRSDKVGVIHRLNQEAEAHERRGRGGGPSHVARRARAKAKVYRHAIAIIEEESRG